MWTIIELSADLFQAGLAIYFMRKTCNLRKHAYTYDVIAAALTALVIWVTSLFGLYYLDFINDIIPLLYAMYLTQNRKSGCIFWAIVSGVINSVEANLSSALIGMYTGHSWEMLLEQNDARISYIISGNLLLAILYIVIGNLCKGTHFLSKQTVACFISSVIVQLVASEIFFFIRITSAEENMMSVYGSICMLCSLLLTVSLYEMMIKQAEKQRQLELTYQTTLLINAHQEEMKTVYSSMLSVQHDLRHRITAAEKLLSRQSSDTSQEAITLLRGTEVLHNYITGSVAVDAVLTSKAATMNARGITFCFYPIPLNQLPMEEQPFAVLLSNILDNAIEGTLRITNDAEEHFVELILSRNWDMFSLTCNNTMNPDTIKCYNNEFVSSKPHPSVHGYGTKSIRQTVEEAGGMVDFAISGNIFSVKIILPMEDEKC